MQSTMSMTHEALGAAVPGLAEADIGMLVALGDGRIEYANPLAGDLLGDATLAGQRLLDVVACLAAEYQGMARRAIARLGSPEARAIRGAVLQLRQAYAGRWLRIDVLRSGAVAGQPRWLLLLLDLGTAHPRRSNRPLAHAKLTQMIDATPVGICMSNDQGRFEHVNPAFQRLFGYTDEELIGREITQLAPAETRAKLAAWQRACIATGEAARGEWSLVDSEGVVRDVLAENCRVSGADGRYRTVTLVVDISERKALECELREKNRVLARMVAVDSLTGLNNRRRTLETLRQRLRSAQRYDRPLVLVMIDLDDFKTVNDRHGHAVGDEVLVAFARLLKAASRGSDSVGRIGGEEFLLIMPESDAAGACGFLDRLRAECAALRFSVPELSMNFSAGVYSRQDGDDAAALFTRADQALYAAKRQGRGRQCVWQK